MVDNDFLVSSAENDDLGNDLSPEIDEDELEADESELDESEQYKGDEIVQKDYKQKFNSAMSNLRKVNSELAMLKSNKSDGDVSKEDLDKLREKYDEEDLEIIQKMIKRGIQDHSQSTLAQKEQNIFEKNHPEISDAQLKHINRMQKEFGYSLEYAYNITFAKPGERTPVKHSISGGSEEPVVESKDKGKQEDDAAYADMKKNYGA